jgi:glycine cleavage system H protein
MLSGPITALPPDLLVLVEHQTWARLADDGSATVGITALGIHLSGEIYMCRPKGVGLAIEQGRSVAVVELAKSIVSVKSPLSGTVLEVNPVLAEHPERVHQDPYGTGWLLRLQATALEQDRAQLLQGAAAARAMVHHAWLHQADGDA